MIERLLDGHSVLDLSTTVAGTYGARLLASMGAEVTKVEAPDGGDPIRAWPPFPEDSPHPEKSGLFLFLNAGKRSITLDITKPTGRDILIKLAADADVLVEDSEPETMQRLDLDYVTLSGVNPSLVYCSVTPFGQCGPYRRYRATDLVAFALGGVTYTFGEPDKEPLTPRGPHTGFIGGTMAAVATLTALYYAGLTGQGQHVDVSVVESVINILENPTTVYEYSGQIRKRNGAGRTSHYVAILPTRTGYIGVNTVTPQNWETMCYLMGMPELLDDPGLATGPMRAAHWQEITDKIGPWLAERTKEEIYETAQVMRVPFGIARTVADVFNSPQHVERGFFVEVESQSLGRVKVPSLPFREAGGSAAPLGPAPTLGEHNAEIYQRRLGLTAGDMAALRLSRII